MATAIQQFFALCKQTIGKHSLEKRNNILLSKELLLPIISSINKMTKGDIYFCPNEFKKQDESKRNPAPVSYMELYREKKLTLAVFVVKSGNSLPLHDHPNMFGILKVIHGSVKLISYNETAPESVSNDPLPENIKQVTRNPDIIVSSEDECCVLTPCDGNIHEIEPLTDFAAFFDVLTPSYGDGDSCHFYQEIEKPANSKSRFLVQIPEPDTYWCDSLPYKGPRLM